MSRIVGRIKVDGHQAGTIAQAPGMALDHAGRQGFPHTVELPGPDRVFKARQRWLRSQIQSRDWVTVEQHLVNWIRPQTRRVVGIWVAAGNREYTLGQQLAQRMIDLPSLPLVFQTPGQAAGQAVASLGRLQQDGSAIGTTLPLIELQHGGFGKNLREQQTRWRAIFMNYAG